MFEYVHKELSIFVVSKTQRCVIDIRASVYYLLQLLKRNCVLNGRLEELKNVTALKPYTVNLLVLTGFNWYF